MDPELGKILNYNFTKDQIIFIKIIMTFPNNIIIPSVKILKCLKHFKISLLDLGQESGHILCIIKRLIFPFHLELNNQCYCEFEHCYKSSQCS